MIRFTFENGHTDWIDAKVAFEHIGNGMEIGITIDGENYPRGGYLMIDKQESYVDWCESPEVDEFESVIAHLALTGVEVDEDWWEFVEFFHPNYNCDKIAWIDDLDCALHNETDNASHWLTIAEEGLVGGVDADICRAIYNNIVWGEESNLIPDDLSTFGEYIINTYGSDIEELRDLWDDEVLAESTNNFKTLYL